MKLIDIIVIIIITICLYIATKFYSRNKGCGCNSQNCTKKRNG